MRISRWFFTLPLATSFACTDPVKDDTATGSRQIAPVGVIRGTVLYQGPRPCSSKGHIVGNAIVLLFDRRNPPPPAGLANTAVNFAAIPGDVLFANEPRWSGQDVYCPAERGYTETLTVSAPFAVSPLAGGSYVIQSFFDTTGNFLPTFKFRNLPERGDVGGGDIDTAAALQPVNQNDDYLPDFLPVDVGIPRKQSADAAASGLIPIFDIPSEGFVADNVMVTIGKVLTNTRPYCFVQGLVPTAAGASFVLNQAQSSDQPYGGDATGIAGATELTTIKSNADEKYYMPILTIPADIHTFAPPTNPLMSGQPGADKFEFGGKDSKGNMLSGLPHIRLRWAGSDAQLAAATKTPYNMQISPFTGDETGGGFRVWEAAWLNPNGKLADGSTGPIYQSQYIPDSSPSNSIAPTPYLWPLVVLAKLAPDPTHTTDPASLQAQGDAKNPVVVMQGITLWGGADKPTPTGTTDNDSVYQTVASANAILGNVHNYIGADGQPVIFHQDHLTVALRPAAICFNTLFDANNSDKRGELVTPYLFSDSADTMPVSSTPVVPLDLLNNGDPGRVQANTLVKAPAGAMSGTPPANQGCLPQGRYAINVVYPTGQAWTIPNEAGACTGDTTGEGATNWGALSCKIQPRAVIESQGPRAVVEVVAPTDPNNCKPGGTVPATPAICLPTK